MGGRMLEIGLWILVVIAGLILLHRLFLWMETKGWVYYAKKKPQSGWGDVFLGGNVFDPGVTYLKEARQEKTQEEEEDGDDDAKRKAEDQVS
jgi:hypothetical protein